MLVAPLGAGQPPADGVARIEALDPRWTVHFDAAPAAPAGFDQQAAYVPLKNGELQAVGLERGEVRWTVPLATAQPPATGDGLVFAAGDAVVTALDQRTGATVWRAAFPGPLHGPVFWDTGWLLVSSAAGELTALGAQDGVVRWRSALGAPLAVPPAAAGDQLYVALTDQRIAALALATGTVTWTTTLRQVVTGLLALDDQLLVGTRANLLHSLALDQGRRRWTQKVGADVAGAPVADERFIYFTALDNVLRALDRGNGNLRWKRNLPSRPRGGPLLIGRIVLVPFVTTDVGAYGAATGAEEFTIRAVGELAGAPFLRETLRLTSPRLVAMSREGALQGFGQRIEPPPAPLTELPGARVGG